MKELNVISYFCRSFTNRRVDLPIRSSDMGLLIFISENSNVTSSEAKDFFEVSKPMISSMVSRLIKEHLILKKSSITDQRVKLLQLTEKGSKFVKESKNPYIAYEKNLKTEMGTEEYIKLIKQLELANNAIRRIK